MLGWFLVVGCCAPTSLLGGTVNDETVVRRALGREAPGEARVQGWSGRSIPNVRVYAVEGGGMVPIGVAVIGQGAEKRAVRGHDAYRELVALAGQGDPHLLAQLSVQFVEPGQAGGEVIPTNEPVPDMPPELAPMVAQPALADGTLTYWRWPASIASDRTQTVPEPWRCRLVTATLVVSCEPGSTVLQAG